jgi:hypothetical protein
MKNVLGAEISLDDALLDGMRQVADPPADRVAASMCERGDHRVFAQLIKSQQVWQENGEPSPLLQPDVRQYLQASSTLPAWHDPAIIKHAEEFFLLFGLSSATLLCCASLPECYVMKYGTEVLAFTKFLQADPSRRIRETAQMVMDVMCPGGLVPAQGVGRGVHATQKVRLMHAIIRHMIEHDPGSRANPIDPALHEKFGKPINQEDMAYTLMTFSSVVIEGYGHLGVRMSADDKGAYVHCWNVVGSLMGIREELLPADFEASRELFTTIQRRQHGESDAGRKLTRALLGVLEPPMPRRLKALPAVLTRELVGNESADALGIAIAPLFDRVVLWIVLRFWAAAAAVLSRLNTKRPYRLASEFLHRRIMDRLGGLPGNAPFDFPPEFIDHWFPGEEIQRAAATHSST